MKLHLEVAHDVGLMVKKIVLCPEYERDVNVHRVAEQIVRTRAFADTVMWINYIANGVL